jgi:hypothetical protein
MGKHNKPRRYNRGGQIAIAAAAASVLAGWAAPVAYADEGADTDKPSNPVSRTADAVKSTVDGVRKAVTDVGSSLQGAARSGLQAGAGGNGTATSLFPNGGPKSKVDAQETVISRQTPNAVTALAPPTPSNPAYDTPTGSVTIPIVDVTLPYLPDAPRFAFPTPSPGFPPGFGSQGTNTRLPFGPAGALTNGNNLFGLNFFNIGNNNLFTANNIGTGLQGIIAGNGNTLAGNQVIAPTSFGTNFGWMGNNNGPGNLTPTQLLNLNPADLLNLNPLQIPLFQGSGNNIVASPFSYGNNTFIMGNDNQGTGNNIMLGAGNFGNNMHWIGDNADFSGNNVVAGIGSIGNNMSIIGNDSQRSGNNGNLGAFGFANNMGLIGSAASFSGNNVNASPFGGFAQNFVVVGDGADFSGNNTNASAFGGFAQNIALIGAGADRSGNNSGIFNFALVGPGVQNAGNNSGGFNVAILPRPGQNCTGPACFNFLGAQFGN